MERSVVELPSGTTVSFLHGGLAEGSVVVLLHAGGVDHGLLSWGAAAPALIEAGYRVLIPDHPGYGESPMPEFAVTMVNLTDYLIEFINELGLSEIALVGVSMGGAMALSYTLAASDDVRSLVLVGSYGLQDKSPAHLLSFVLVRIPGLMWLQQRLITSSRWLLRRSVRQIIRHDASVTPALLDEVAAAARHPSSQRAFAQFQRDEIRLKGVRTNLTARLGEIGQPTLLVHGSRDIGVPVAAAGRAAQRLPDARLVVIEGAGHWTQRDVPEEFADLLLAHLAGARR
ncbi:MAG: alpha/beta hydrolase [Microlunatus sp.]|nr:alpha/beta hydrolase [Microlunatus sp.]